MFVGGGWGPGGLWGLRGFWGTLQDQYLYSVCVGVVGRLARVIKGIMGYPT